MDQNHLINFERGPRIIPVKFGQIPISGLGGDVVSRLKTDRQTDDDNDGW